MKKFLKSSIKIRDDEGGFAPSPLVRIEKCTLHHVEMEYIGVETTLQAGVWKCSACHPNIVWVDVAGGE